MNRETVMAMLVEDVQEEIATLRGIRRMRQAEIAQRYGLTMEEAAHASERWIWEGKEESIPREMLMMAVESEYDRNTVRLIAYGCPGYTDNICAAWELWKLLPQPKAIWYGRAEGQWWLSLSWGKPADPDDEYADRIQAHADMDGAEIIARAFILYSEGQ